MTNPIAVVTGGAGFIGSHMVDLLLEHGYSVRVIDNMSSGKKTNLAQHASNGLLTVEEADIRFLSDDSSLFRGAEWVFHFAGLGEIIPSIEKPVEYMEVNVQGTVRVLEAARKAGVKKIIYAASSSCYGLAAVPTREDAPIAPQYPYALSKYIGEHICFHWHRVYRLPVHSLRIFNAYGIRSRTSGAYGAVIGVFLKQKLENRPFTLTGDGSQKRDFIYVSDVVEAFYRAATSTKVGQIYNIGAGNPQSIRYLVELLQGNVIYLPKRPGEPECTWADISKVSQDLDWRPTVSFEEGIKRVLHNIEYWREAPLWDPQSIAQSTKIWFDYLSCGTVYGVS